MVGALLHAATGSFIVITDQVDKGQLCRLAVCWVTGLLILLPNTAGCAYATWGALQTPLCRKKLRVGVPGDDINWA